MSANRSNVLKSIHHRVDRGLRDKIGLQSVTNAATENQIEEIAAPASLRSRHKMILRGHHEAIVVGLQIEATVDASTPITLKELQEFGL
jgi:hypothetical protein